VKKRKYSFEEVYKERRKQISLEKARILEEKK
jgi:hypothetical protein